MSGLVFSLNEASYTIAGKPLFEALSMQIHERDRICLVGKNGAGKTTLMRMITGDLEPDGGKRFLHPGISVGYLAQKVAFDPNHSVREFVLSGLPEIEEEDAYDYRADMVIAPLELDASREMRHLSGGQLRRAALARALVMEPDILLLDEPTNHLDVGVIEWLEGYLASYRGALLCVSHDRTFLGNISSKTFWLEQGAIRVCPKGYTHFDRWMEQFIEQESRALKNLEKQVQAEHDWTQGGVTGRRKRNVRRLRELDALRTKLRQDKAAYKQRSQKLDMDPIAPINNSKLVAEFKSVSKSFTRVDGNELRVLNAFSHKILKGDKIGILGKNGVGKSSLIKLITGELEPDQGSIFRSKQLRISYFDQNRSALNPNKSLWETLCPEGGNYVYLETKDEPKPIHVCGYLKRFLFDPARAQDKVGTLSGGQQNRLLLAKVLARPGNLLILDEPTNDLDMDTLDMLQEMLHDYHGTLILVSHDRDFLDRCVTEIYGCEGNGKIHTTIGGYSDYVREQQAARHPNKASNKASSVKSEPELAGKIAVKEAEAIKPLTYGERLELQELPERISQTEQDLATIQARLDTDDLYQQDPDGLSLLLNQYEQVSASLATMEQRWLDLEERNLE